MNLDKKNSRLRRAKRSRSKICQLGAARLSVHRTPRHMYAQIISADGKVLANATTLQKDISSGLKYTGNVEAAVAVGKAIGERAAANGITEVAFDRSGFQYHGRVKALADAAREAGLKF
jgi:large subunit ribosomal protein L18